MDSHYAFLSGELAVKRSGRAFLQSWQWRKAKAWPLNPTSNIYFQSVSKSRPPPPPMATCAALYESESSLGAAPCLNECLVWYEFCLAWSGMVRVVWSGLVWSEFCLFVWVWSGMCCCVGAVLGGEGKPHMNSIQFLSNRSERKGFNPRRYPPTPFSILSWQANFCTCKISFHWFSILAGKLICVHVRSLFFSLMAGKAGQGKFLSMSNLFSLGFFF